LDFVGEPLVVAYPTGWTKRKLRAFVLEELRYFLADPSQSLADVELRELDKAGEDKLYSDGFAAVELDQSADAIFGVAAVVASESIFDTTRFKVEAPATSSAAGGQSKRKKGGLTFERCLESSFEKERLGKNDTWYCPDCKNHVRAFKKMEIWSLADTMIVGLKRFSQIMGAWSARSEKNTSHVDIPHVIDMRPYIVGPQRNEDMTYELYAVVHHFGGLGGGHYTAYGKHQGKWYDFNDSSVTELRDDEVIDGKSAYVLFYRRIRRGKRRAGDDESSGEDEEAASSSSAVASKRA